MQAPSGYYSIEAKDDSRGEDSDVTDNLPWLAISQVLVCTGSIGGRVPANDKFGDHAGDSKKKDAQQIHHDEGRATVLSRHIRETPHIAKSYC